MTQSKELDFYEEYCEGFSRKHITTCIISVILYFVLPDLISNIILGTSFLYNWFFGTSDTFRYIFNIVLQDVPVFILIMAVFGKYILHSLRVYFGGGVTDAICRAGIIIIAYMAIRLINLILSPIAYYFNQNQNQNQETINTVTESIPVLMLIVAVIIGPVVEEIIFRWGIFRPIYKHSPFLAYIASSGLFAFAHIAQSVFAGNLYEFANFPLYFAVGFLIAYIYKKTSNFSAALLLHFLNNAVSMVIIISVV